MILVNGLFSLLGLILLAAIFIVAGFQKAGDIAGTTAYFGALGLDPRLVWPVAIFEIVAGFAILIGFMTRPFALLLAAFCILSALFAHRDFSDPLQAASFMKNLAMAGGFLILFAYGNAAHSLDSMRARRRLERRDARVTKDVRVEKTADGRVVRDETVRHV